MKADILREKYLDFFKSKKHKVVLSDSLIPVDDPTVLFTPAGMNQFKKQFMGFNAGFTRAVSSQRCLRTDDLDKVGKTAVHHTFFEMLGNFSFGDYFKDEAIQWAWEFLIEELKIPQERLWVSVYQEDSEAYLIWKDKVGIPKERIVKLGDHDNFWPADAKEKGPNGPCGPCSEIFYDFGEDVGCGEKVCDPSCSCGRFAEIWNLVFTQYNRKDGGILEPLPKKNIDTGMGLERLTAVMQGVKNNFQTELFQPIVKEIEDRGQRTEDREKENLLYAVSDHIRAVVFSIYDGVIPSNEARGYVIRKIIRKSLMHLRALEVKLPFLYKLVPVVSQVMLKPYPELRERQENITQIILSEEKAFIATLETSDKILSDKFSDKKNSQEDILGVLAFELYDTNGVPFEITKDWLSKNKFSFKEEKLETCFSSCMEEQKARSKQKSAMKGDVFGLSHAHLAVKKTNFLGYKSFSGTAKLLKILTGKSQGKKIKEGEEAVVILDKTCFYPESGGQVGDTGLIIKGKNIFEVLSTQKVDKVILHHGRVKKGSFKLLDQVTAEVDQKRRMDIARNHTTTHLLQAALRKVLGEHIRQQGSLVSEEKLRFDFSHFKAITGEELSRIEEEVNKNILEAVSLEVKEMPIAMAKKKGALAFFGEKYEDKVRMVSVADVSRELCGGTHLDNTAQAGSFKIIHESSVASGVRRIEAVTGLASYKAFKKEEELLGDLAQTFNVNQESLKIAAQKSLARVKELEKELSANKMTNLKSGIDQIINSACEINGVKFIGASLDNLDIQLLRKNMDLVKEKTNNAVVALASATAGKVFLVIGVTSDIAGTKFDANMIIKQVGQFIGGSGGGRADFAQAGGTKPENIDLVFDQIKKIMGNLQ
ncbi:MAG: alanine--tRNA ligase [Candidatus Omnitrophica bacterium]|jgi:alanyl-tRNA synthetase|nr:alanine--tRNA ligase [Candidatus Omnitrophota bacterium]